MGTRRDSRTMSATSSRCESSRRVMIFGDGRVIGVMDVKTYRPPHRFG
jgi:putative methionine-R-sulfoxide reductase with GAF domain